MSRLTIYPEKGPDGGVSTDDPAEIAMQLAGINVLFERWSTDRVFTSEASQEEVIDAYRSSVDRLFDRYEFRSVDVVSLRPDHPDKKAMRAKFLSEHTHSEFEVRFFVDGRGLFYLHHDSRVFLVLCERGDLLSVPSGVKHWFDMGEHPDFKCIRLFTNPDGWVAQFTGDSIAERFPSFEDYLALPS